MSTAITGILRFLERIEPADNETAGGPVHLYTFGTQAPDRCLISRGVIPHTEGFFNSSSENLCKVRISKVDKSFQRIGGKDVIIPPKTKCCHKDYSTFKKPCISRLFGVIVLFPLDGGKVASTISGGSEVS